MIETLSVQNFAVIKKAEIEVKKINIIIGPQANGKSITAKLIYYFKSMSNDFLDGIRSQHSKRELDKQLLISFEEKFPRYSWEGTSFIIKYRIEDIEISLEGKKNSKNKTTLAITYSNNLARLFNAKKALFKKKLGEVLASEKASRRIGNTERHVMWEYVTEPLKREGFNYFFCDPVFIPASRSFFANLQKNIFTFLASNLDIDPYLKEFGGLYENSKRFHKDAYVTRRNPKLQAELSMILEAIVSGDYEYHDEQDWIVAKNRRINLANASSGQQESLPMLLVLTVWPLLRGSISGNMYFIEEPEAHLFPTSQSHIVSLISKLYESANACFFITSHSPYILSALNNFILAGDAIASGKITSEEFQELNGPGSPILFEDVSAYTINNGFSQNIADPDYRMIGGDMLDNISEHFESVMNNILARE